MPQILLRRGRGTKTRSGLVEGYSSAGQARCVRQPTPPPSPSATVSLPLRERIWLSLAALLIAWPAAAQEVVTSPAADAVSVTIYRAPDRGQGAIDLHWLGGFALITETRTVRLPAGRATLRFEGVADGIVPVSAIVTGLPGGVVEKNRDARLLSPAALIDGSLGRRVTLHRTDKRSGRVREDEAVLVSGTEGGVVVRTHDGIETLGCSGLGESVRYPRVPDGLSAKPVLSVETVSRAPITARVTLSYLASEFDWSASYVATVAADGRTLDLSAWMTLANGNAQGFAGASVQAVAGRLNHQVSRRGHPWTPPLQLRCYPLGTTTNGLRLHKTLNAGDAEVGDIIVTGMRVAAPMMAVPAPPPPPPPPEDLGDLKLYRVPERVTVAANAQKQVLLLARSRVPFQQLYRLHVTPGARLGPTPTRIVLKLSNKAADGLGLPLPAGGVALYAPQGKRLLLTGEGAIGDKAVGETVRFSAGESAQVLVEQSVPEKGVSVLTVSNANAAPVTIELPIGGAGGTVTVDGAGPLAKVDGVPTWTVTVPPGERRVLTYWVR